MKIHGRPGVLVAIVLFFWYSAAPGQGLTKAEIAQRGKAATAFVEVKSRNATGSSFCIHPSGLFITNEHVVLGASDITLVLNAGQKDQKILKAKAIRSEPELDLALLQVEGLKDLPALPLGSEGTLAELSEVIACGFPFGLRLAEDQDYPAISINQGSVASLRQKDGKLQRIQLDVELNPGNSGGPVLDSGGKVVGVVVAGVKGARVNFAIPVSHLSQFVQKPEIQFVPPALDRSTVHKPLTFEARALTLLPAQRPPELELVLRSGTQKERRFKMEPVEGGYWVRAVAVPRPDGPVVLRVQLNYSDGSVQGSMEDRSFQVGGRELRLEEVKQLHFGDKPRVVLTDGRTLEGALTNLDAVPVRLGGEKVMLNFLKTVDAQLTSPTASASVLCTVVATEGGKEVGRLSRRIGYGVNSGDASGNLLVNGSFEDGPEPNAGHGITLPKGSTAIKGWVVTDGDVDLTTGLWQVVDGKRTVDLDGNVSGAIAQTFRTQPGQTYLVTFSLAGNPGAGPAVKTLRVSAAGTGVNFDFDVRGKSNDRMGWETKTWEFTAVADQTTLEFRSTSGNTGAGPVLDKVSVIAK